MKYTENEAVDVLVWDYTQKRSTWLPGRFLKQVAATDREFRYSVELEDGRKFPEAAPECVKKRDALISVRVRFGEAEHNYTTSVAKDVTDVEAEAYFKGKQFDVGQLNHENLKTCIGIDFNYDY